MSSLRRSVSDHDDDVMDEEDDDEENEPTTLKSGNDTCLASHEFEWLGPSSLNIGQGFSSEKCRSPLEAKQELGERNDIRLTSPPANANYQCKRLSAFYPKQPPVADNFGYRLSPSTCWGGHGYYHLSPVRSSWCCPSPPPTVPFCCHHGGGGAGIPSAEMIPYSGEICEDSTCYPCCNYPPPMPPHSHSDLHLVHHHTSPRSGGKESPVPRSSPETRPASRRSRSAGSKRRDYSPLPPSISNEPLSPQLLPLPPRNFTERNRGSLHKEYESNVQKISQLENDKKNLSLQVTVLTCQVEAQSEKITELETILSEMKAQMKHTEHLLQQEVLTRSTIENSKTLLMSEISNLKLKLNSAEKERKSSDERCRKIESDVMLLQSRLAQKEAELSALRNTLSQDEMTLTTKNKCVETEDLRPTLGSVLFSSEEKLKNEDLKLSQTKCKTLQDYALPEHSKKALDHCVGDATFSNFAVSQEPDLSSSMMNEGIMKDHLLIEQHQVPRSVIPVTSTPVETDVSLLSWKESTLNQDSMLANDRFSPLNSSYKSSSEENICVASSKGSQTSSRYGTMPRQTSLQEAQQYLERSVHPEIESRRAVSKNSAPEGKSFTSVESSNVLGLNIPVEKKEAASKSHSTRNKSSGVSFGKGFFKLRSGKRSTSAPELGDGIDSLPHVNPPLHCCAFLCLWLCSWL